jgi:ADP-ribose pyrophosphatase
MSNNEHSGFQSSDVEIMAVERVYQGFFSMLKYRLRHRLFQGGWSEAMSRELFERGDAVVVLPYDPVRDQIVVLEQFRVGALNATYGPWLIEFVAGMIEQGETIDAVAHREAMEEAGLTLQALEPIGECLVSPGGTSERLFLYCGHVSAEGVGGIHGLDSEHEDIRVSAVDFAEARAWLEQGRINSAGPIIAMQWLVMNRERLRQQWQA